MEQEKKVEEMNVYQRLLAISSEISRVAKGLTVGTGQYSYKAVSEADVLNAVRPMEEQYRIYSYPESREIVDFGFLDKGNRGTQTYIRIKTVYRFVNVDKPDEYITVTSYGDGLDNADKAPGKAITYSDKYALLKAYKIMTGDDPDAIYSEEGSAKKTQPKTQATRTSKGLELERMIDSVGANKPDTLKMFKHDSFDQFTDEEAERLKVMVEKARVEKARVKKSEEKK